MHCSTLKTKGGMVSVTKNYLNYKNWGEYDIKFIPTHFDSNKYVVMLYFCMQFVKIAFTVWFGNYKIAHLHTAERGSFWRKAFLMNFFHQHGIRVVMHHHAAEFEDFYSKCSELQKEKINNTLEAADLNIVLSERLVPMIKDKAPKANVEVLYNAVNTYSKNPYNMNGKYILFLGRLGERKGSYDLLKSIRMLDGKIPSDIQFCLCGDGEIDKVKEKIQEYNIGHRIAHVGWIDGEQKQRFLENTIVNVLPSYNEGLPMTILETMAYGIPNVSTNIASIPEVIKDGENGFLISPGDVNALAESICRLVADKDIRKNFSDASYELVTREFSLDNNIARLKEFYKTIL
ncbi:MAG: glycosyltransferase family 4 protein [Roseburia sp.]|nr:glycosyltransferase family 4 protein [Roseburia sp.]MCM1439894.1 glycosyltransferase family 4 protein [Roseburia sp.]